MATIVEVINSFDQSSKEYDSFIQDLITTNNDIPFDTEEVETIQNTVITAINTRLNLANTRYNGLILLEHILPRCSKDILSKYCILWMAKATQILESTHSSIKDLTLACKIIGSLIIQSKEISEIQKQVSMQNVKQIVTAISNLEPNIRCGATYYLIAVLLYYYPEVCERFQVAIRKMVLTQIDSTQKNLVNATSKCYALLAKATERSFKSPSTTLNCTGWIYHQMLLCNSLHIIMDELFSGLIELENVDAWYTLELPSIPTENVIQYYYGQKQRFLNLCVHLSSMLRFEDKNSVLPYNVLQVLCRGLAIIPSNLKYRNTLKEQMLYLILPKLHIGLLSVLDALIDGFKLELIPYGSTILRLFNQTLQWTGNILENQVTINSNKPFKHVRISLYKCLISWLTCTNSVSGIETVANEYLPTILKDIIPEKDRILLTVQKTQHLSKKALKRLRDSQYEKTAPQNTASSTKGSSLDVDLCVEALITLQNILHSGSVMLSQTFFKTLQSTLIPVLYDLYLSCEPNFYQENTHCRLQLLTTLRALEMNPHSLASSSTQYSIEIFEMALYDVNSDIIQEARLALTELEKVLHPCAPTLQLTRPEEVENECIMSDNDDNDDTSISEPSKRNLIGSENAVDEITPSLSKRLRISTNEPEANVENTVGCTVESIQDKQTEKPDNLENENQMISECENMAAEKTEEMSEPQETSTQVEETNDNTNLISNNVDFSAKLVTINKEDDTQLSQDAQDSKDDTQSKISTLETDKEYTEQNMNISEKPAGNESNLLIEEEADQDEILKLFHDQPKDSEKNEIF